MGFRSAFLLENKVNSNSLNPSEPQVLIKMAQNRTRGRNVHIYSAKDTRTVIGGLIVTNGMTNDNFYSMVEITFILDKDYKLRYEGGTTVPRDDKPLQQGKYFINIAGSLMTNNEPWLVRTGNGQPKISNRAFRNAVRKRDRGCVITEGRGINVEYEYWDGYSATHIFPLEHAEHWVDPSDDCSITTPVSRKSASRRSASRRSTGVYSVQNGVLLRSDIRKRFERYLVSINPDVSPQICFSEFQLLTIFLGQL